MVSRRSDRLLYKITHHTNLARPYDKNISGLRFPAQDSEKLGREITLRYVNKYIPEKIEEDNDEFESSEENIEEENINTIYENDFIIVRCDQSPPYRFIGISVDYTVILVGDSRTYDDEDLVFKYPKQIEEYLGLYLTNEYVENPIEIGEAPPDQIQKLRGVVLSCDSTEPCNCVIAEFYEGNKTRFLLESEVLSVVMDRYDPDGERDYDGIDPEDHGLVFIDLNGKFATSEGESIYLDANGGYPDPLADMYRKDILSPEEVCELRRRIIEEREIFGLDQIYPRKITLNKYSIGLDEGETFQLIATIPHTTTYNTITWTSSDETIATVDENGLVTSIGSGKAKIYATCLDVWARCTVIATVDVQGVELNKSSIEIIEGEYEVLVATVLPENASNKKVVWSSSNEDVAKVTQKGKVTVLSPGTATITVTTKDGGFTASCEVTGISSYIPVESIRVYNDNIDMNNIILSPNGYTYSGGSYPKSVTFNVEILPANATNKAINIRGQEILPESGASTTNRSDYCCYARKISDNLVEIEACCNWCFNSDIYRVYSLDNNSIYQDIKISRVYTAIEDFEFAPSSQSDLFMDLDDPLFNSGKSININLYPRLWTANHIQLIGVEMGMAYSLASSVRNYGDITNMISTLDYNHMIYEPSTTTAAVKYFIPYPKPNPSPGIQTLEVTNPNNGEKKTVNVTIGQQSISRLRITNIPQDWSQYSPGDQFTVNVECTPNYWTNYPNFYGVINWSVSGNNNVEIITSGTTQNQATIKILSECEDLVITATSSKFPNMTDSFTMTIEDEPILVNHIRLYNDQYGIDTDNLQTHIVLSTNGYTYGGKEYPKYIDLNVEITPADATDKSINVSYLSIVNYDAEGSSEPRQDYCTSITKISDSVVRIEGVSYSRKYSYDWLEVYSNDGGAEVQLPTVVITQLEDFEFDIDPQDLKIGFHEQKEIVVNFYPQNWSVNHIEKNGVISKDYNEDAYNLMDSLICESEDLSMSSYTDKDDLYNDDKNPVLHGTIYVTVDEASPMEYQKSLTLSLTNPNNGETKSIELEFDPQPLESIEFTDVPEDWSEYAPGDSVYININGYPEWWASYNFEYEWLNFNIVGDNVTNVTTVIDDTEGIYEAYVEVTASNSSGDVVRLHYSRWNPISLEVEILGECRNVRIIATSNKYPSVTASFTMNISGGGDIPVEYIRVYNNTYDSGDNMSNIYPLLSTNNFWNYPSNMQFNVEVYPANATDKSITIVPVQSGQEGDYCSTITKISDININILSYCATNRSEMFDICSTSDPTKKVRINTTIYTKIESFEFDVSSEDLSLDLYYNSTDKYYTMFKYYLVNCYPRNWSVNHLIQAGPSIRSFTEPTITGSVTGLSASRIMEEDSVLGIGKIAFEGHNINKPGTIVLSTRNYDSGTTESLNINIGKTSIAGITITDIPEDKDHLDIGRSFYLNLSVDPFYWNNWSSMFGSISWSSSNDSVATIGAIFPDGRAFVRIVGYGTATLTAYSAKNPNISNSVTLTAEEPSTYLYDWDFTNSLVDTNGTNATFFTNIDDPTSITTTPATGQYVSGTGIIMNGNYYALQIPVDLLSKTTSYTVEIDFSNFELLWASWTAGFLTAVNIDAWYNSISSGLNSDWGYFVIDSYDSNGNYHSSNSNINSAHYFENSTMKIINRITTNNNVVWDIYKDDILMMTTDEYQSDGVTPVFWDNSVIQDLFAISGDNGSFTITGMRISETE